MRRPGEGWLWTAVATPVVAVATTLALTACDTGARKDLPQENQQFDESQALVVLNPDKFPNATHKCVADGAVGIWATTQGNVWIVYNDPLCPGAEGSPLVFDNIPGSQQQSGGEG